VYLADIQQISTLKANLAMKFQKSSGEIFIIKSATRIDGDRIYLQFCARKRVKSIKIHPEKK
jgi:hypothetical protein